MCVIVSDPLPVVKEPEDFHAAPGEHPAGQGRPHHEIADIFRLYGADYRRRHPLTLQQWKVMRDLESCRTALMGGHIQECGQCGLRRPVFNSCRNRNCPKCQKLHTAAWLAARQGELLPVGYFHNVFTMPHELNPLTLANPGLIYNQLFRSVAAALMQLAADPAHGLGGLPAFTAILHTWNQQLEFHPHVHCVIAGGALAPDGSRWLKASHKELFAMEALSRAYRDHFLKALRRARRRAELVLPPGLTDPGRFEDLLELMAAKHWVCFSRPYFDQPEKALDYISRYTHRVAIGNHRLLAIEGGEVTFIYHDRRDGNRVKQLTLAAEEFIRRYLLHITPKHLKRMRHYGILCSRAKKQRLDRCRELLAQAAPEKKALPTNRLALLLQLTGVDMSLCPACGGTLNVAERWRRGEPTPSFGPGTPPAQAPPATSDTS